MIAATPIPEVPPAEPVFTYRVVGVANGDYLNMREGPGQSSPSVQRLQNGVDGITLISGTVNNDGTDWQKIESRGVQGWVAARYLAPNKVISVKRALPVGIESDGNFVPTELKLASSGSFPASNAGIQIGATLAPIGSTVKLVRVVGDSVVVEYQGQQGLIPNSETDLMDRMLGVATQ